MSVELATAIPGEKVIVAYVGRFDQVLDMRVDTYTANATYPLHGSNVPLALVFPGVLDHDGEGSVTHGFRFGVLPDAVGPAVPDWREGVSFDATGLGEHHVVS